MKILCDKGLFPGWLVTQIKPPQRSATFFIKGTFKLQHNGPATCVEEAESVSGDRYIDDDVGRVLLYPSDFAPFKPRADVVVNATAHAPGKTAVTGLEVAISVGQFSKRLLVAGKRRWKHARGSLIGITKPESFTQVPITYENAFGGKSSVLNPIGKGKDTDELPYLELPGRMVRNAGDTIDPAGFGPLPGEWQQRKRLVGTYDDKYLKDRWPWFPEDFDWRFFNAAPEDQQVEGYLRGDESLEFHNLHQDYQTYRSQLPGLRARCFYQEELPTGEEQFREVPLNLDTLWIDLESETLVLVWRGIANVRSMKLKEISHLFVIAESLRDEKGEVQDYKQLHQDRLAQEEAEDEAFEVFERPLDPDQEYDDPEVGLKSFDEEVAAAEALADKAEHDHMALLPGSGIDPKRFEPGPAPETFADARAEIHSAMLQLQELNPEHAAELEEFEEEFSAIEDLEDTSIADEDLPFNRETVMIGAKRGESFAGMRFSGLDLSHLSLAGLNLSNGDFRDAKLVGTDLSGADLEGADLSGVDLSGADLTGANLDGATLNDAILSNAKVVAMSISDTDFSGLDLQGMDFSGCKGVGADFSEADLANAIFRDVKLPQADFCDCILEGADFSGAELPAAQFESVKAPYISMENADITGLHASEGSDFSFGNFRNSRGSGSIWEDSLLEGADFSRADLTNALFPDARLNKTRFDRALLMSAVFDDALLQEAIMTNANLLRVSFERADLTNANMSGSNLYEAGFCEAVLTGTNFQFSNLKGTQLA